MAALAVPRVITMAQRPYEGGEFGEIGFTEQDRRSLIELGVHFETLTKSMDKLQSSIDQRFTDQRVAIAERFTRLETELARKVDRSELTTADQRFVELKNESDKQRDQLSAIKLQLAGYGSVITFVAVATPILIKLFWH